METQDALLEIERRFWSGDAEFYRKNVDERCLIAFLEMAGVESNEEIAGSVKDGVRWAEVKLEVKGFLEPSPDVALFTYDATATRSGGEPYAALVSSGYVRRGGAWKMVFHQQTPRQA
jgi:hypothetical protein